LRPLLPTPQDFFALEVHATKPAVDAVEADVGLPTAERISAGLSQIGISLGTLPAAGDGHEAGRGVRLPWETRSRICRSARAR